MTMTLVSTVTVGAGGAASIDFTSIPQTGTDLLIVISGRGTASVNNDNLSLTLNGNTGSIYTRKTLYGTGSGTGSATGTYAKFYGAAYPGASATSNTFGNVSFYIPNYANGANKSISVDSVTEHNGTEANQTISAGLFASTAAITSLALVAEGGNFAQYSTASLYTIQVGSGGATVS